MKMTKEIKKLLWPNDFSKCSKEALPHVRSLAKQYGAVVHVLYIAEDLAHHESWYGEFDASHIDRILERGIKKARDRQQSFCRKHLADWAVYEAHIEIGEPATKILDFIEKQNIDMVVMCRKGKTGHFNMGSVSQKIVAQSPVPVIVTPNSQ
jgi:nucleotide-binding universal stress UspA family protein